MAKKIQKSVKIVLLVLLVCLAAVSYATAAETKANLKVCQKFFKVIGVDSEYDQLVSVMVFQFQQDFAPAINEIAKKMEGATPEETDKVKQLIQQAISNYSQKMKGKITNVLSLNELTTNVLYPAYSKQFTTSEIEEITKFYESPVGQKYMSSKTTIMQETQKIIIEKYAPQIQKISQKLIDEEMAKIKTEVEKIQKKK